MAKTRFTTQDVKRAVSGARAAGFDVGSVEIRPDGAIVIASAKEPQQSMAPTSLAEFRRMKADGARKA